MLFNLLVEQLILFPWNRHAKVLANSDDVALVVAGPNHVTTTRHLLRRVAELCATLGLVINRAKTRAMAIGHRGLPDQLNLDGELVPWVHVFKYLGVVICTLY